MSKTTIEAQVEEIMQSEPMKRVLAIEHTAIVTGRAGEYFGKTIPEVLRDALTTQQEELVKSVLEFVPEESEEFKYVSPEVKEFARQLRSFLSHPQD